MKLMPLSLVVATSLLASAAHAQQYTLKVGAAFLNPNATSDDLTGTMTLNVEGVPFTITKPVDSGIQLEVQPQTAFIFSMARSFDEHWEAEVLLGFPPTHDVKMRMNNARIRQLATLDPSAPPEGVSSYSVIAAKHIASYDGKVVSTLTQIAPTAFINYKFGTAQSTWRPYVGVGVNFTHVRPKPTPVGEAFYNDGQVKTKVSDSWGLALQAGVSYHIDEQWLISASYATVQVANRIEIQTASGATQYGKYKFNPSIWMLTVGRKF